MDYLRRTVNYANFFAKPSARLEPPEPEEMSTADAYLNFACKVVLWEDPKITWISFLAVNATYLFIVINEIRFFCVFFATLFALVLMDYFNVAINSKDLHRYVSFTHIKDASVNFFFNLYKWRRECPPLVCGVMTFFFLFLSVIGRTISGQALIYYIILTLFFGPQFYRLIPEELSKPIIKTIAAFCSMKGVADLNDFVPIASPENDFNDDNESISTDHTQDSALNSLINGATTMPSYLDVDLNDLDETDLMPGTKSKFYALEGNYSSSDDSDNDAASDNLMKFDALHFKNSSSSSSSSSDEERLISNAPPATTTIVGDEKTTPFLGAGMYQSLASLGSNFLSNYVSTTTSQSQESAAQRNQTAAGLTKSDSDSEFEIINTEDATNLKTDR